MDKKIIKEHLTKTFLVEEKTPGISVTDKAKKESDKINKAGLKAYSKEVKAKEDKDTGKMAQNKFNYTDKFQKTYHDEMEIMNGQEMIQYDSKPSDNFVKKAKEGIEGSSRMGNEGGIGNAEAAFGASSDNFGKDLVKKIKSSEKKRNQQTPTLNLRGRDIQADMKDTGHKPYAIEESISDKNKMVLTNWVNKMGAKQAAEKLINTLSQTGMVSDLPDSNEYGSGLNKVEGYLMKQDLDKAFKTAKALATKLEKKGMRDMFENEENDENQSKVAVKADKEAQIKKKKADFNDIEDYEKIGREVEYGVTPKNIATETVQTDDIFDVNRGGKTIASGVKFHPNGKDYNAPTTTKGGVNIQTLGDRDQVVNHNNNKPNIKESMKLNEDNLEVKNIAKQLYSFLKKNGVREVSLDTSKLNIGKDSANDAQGNQIGNRDNTAKIAYFDDPKTKQTIIEVYLFGDSNKIQEIEKMLLNSFPGLGQINRELNKNSNSPKEKVYYLHFTVAEKTTAKGGLVGNTQQNAPQQQAQQQPVAENKDNNKSNIKESMKRLRFKTNFNGLGNALKLIPEAYRVNKKEFVMTDGNETYNIRWEGNLSEGKAVVLSANDKKLVNEDINRMKQLFGYKSQDTLGLVKGNARVDENKVFGDIWNKSKVLLGESEDMEGAKATEGNWGDKTKKAPEATKHIQGSTSKDKGTQAPKAKEGDLDDAVSQAPESKKHMSSGSAKATEKAKEGNWDDVTGGENMMETEAATPKEGHWEDMSVPQAAEAKKHVHLKESTLDELMEEGEFEVDDEETEETEDNWNKSDDEDSSSEMEPSSSEMGGDLPMDDTSDDEETISVPKPMGKGGAQLLFSPSRGIYWIKGPGLPMNGMEVPEQFLSIASDETKKNADKAAMILKKMEEMEPEDEMDSEF